MEIPSDLQGVLTTRFNMAVISASGISCSVGLSGRERERIVKEMVSGAALTVKITELKDVRQKREAEVQAHEARLRDLTHAVEKVEQRLSNVHQQEAEALKHLAQLTENLQQKTAHLKVLTGFERFLLRTLKVDAPCWNHAVRISRYRGEGGCARNHLSDLVDRPVCGRSATHREPIPNLSVNK